MVYRLNVDGYLQFLNEVLSRLVEDILLAISSNRDNS
jgi:hypothetical protein